MSANPLSRRRWWTWVSLAFTLAASLLIWRACHALPASPYTLGGRTITLTAPGWLGLMALAPWFFWLRQFSLTDLAVAQQVISATLRALVLAALAVALARPNWETQSAASAMVVLVDVSSSITNRQLDAFRDYVEQLEQARGDTPMAVITFSAHPLRRTRITTWREAIVRHTDTAAATDIDAALQLALGILPEQRVPTVLILSDGAETQGDLHRQALRAHESGLRLTWHRPIPDPQPEVAITAVQLPADLKAGQPFEVTVEAWASEAQPATIRLAQNEFANPLEGQRVVTLTPGRNQLKFRSQAAVAGAVTYRATLTPHGRDTISSNNTGVMTQAVKGKPSVLYIEGGLLQDPNAGTHFTKALLHENMDVQTRGPIGLPTTATALAPYDLVVFSDVPAHVIGSAQMQALSGYVQQHGGGLIVVGGEHSFGSGGYQGTELEQLMPVRFDSERTREQPELAVMLVMDRSGSMQGARIEAAKESARVTAEVLSPHDILGVVAFDSDATIYVSPQRAANRMRISSDIARLQAGGGTNIYPGLRQAHDLLQDINAKVKHVILLSDGESPTDGIVRLVGEMRSARITVSCVGVAGSDRNLLASIADAGEGRLYMVDDIGALPRIFMKETQEIQKAQLVEQDIRARVVKHVEAIAGTGVEAAPPLRGYVSTKPKPTAEVILVSNLGEPLLARWRRGAGMAVAWTSDIKNRWSATWLAWQGFPVFWGQLIRSSMRRKLYQSYDLNAEVRDGVAYVTVDAIDSQGAFVNGLDTTLELVEPATQKVIRSQPMRQQAAGIYEASLPFTQLGSYLVRATHRQQGTIVAVSEGGLAQAYPLEHLATTLDGPAAASLTHAVQLTGGSLDPSPQVALAADARRVAFHEDLWPYVVLLAMGLWVLDVLLKRTRLFGYRPLLQ